MVRKKFFVFQLTHDSLPPTHVCVCINMCKCVCIHVSMSEYMNVIEYIQIHVFIYTHIYIYIYICVCIQMYLYIYIYKLIYKCAEWTWNSARRLAKERWLELEKGPPIWPPTSKCAPTWTWKKCANFNNGCWRDHLHPKVKKGLWTYGPKGGEK